MLFIALDGEKPSELKHNILLHSNVPSNLWLHFKQSLSRLSSPKASLLHSHFQPDLKEIFQQRWMALLLLTVFLSNSESKKLKCYTRNISVLALASIHPEKKCQRKGERSHIWKPDKAVRIFTGRHENWKTLEERNTAVGEKGREWADRLIAGVS